MVKETFILRTEWADAIMELKPVEQAIVFRNLFHYHNNEPGKIDIPNISVRLVWKLIEPNLKRNIETYDKRKDTSSDNGRKGGRPPKQSGNLNNLNKPNQEPNNLPVNLTEPNNPIVSVSVPVPVSDSDSISRDSQNDFEVFWNTYGKKSDRHRCEHEWFNMEAGERKEALKKAPLYVAANPDPKFRKNPLNWLEGKCWNDHIEVAPELVHYRVKDSAGTGSMPLKQWNEQHANNPRSGFQRTA